MKPTLVILGHPALDAASFANRQIAGLIGAVPGIALRNLSELYPDYRIDVAAEQAALLAAERIVWQFPFYWYSVPALLKAWIDQVLSYGFAYGSSGTKLHGKELLASFTLGGPEQAYSPTGYNHFTVDQFLAPLQQTASLCGLVWLEPVWTHGTINIPGLPPDPERSRALAREHAARLLARLSVEPFA